MNYCLYKLSFLSPLHIGESSSARSLETTEMTFCADTLFSALAHACLSLGGEKEIERLCGYAKEGKLLLSDAMPYDGANLYLPKPFAFPKKQKEASSLEKKKMKKLSFIPVEKFEELIVSLNGGRPFGAEEIELDFGNSTVVTKVGISGFEETEPYSVGIFTFKKNCGLYLLIGYREEEILTFLERLFNLLAVSGIGGKVSSGYGKFEITQKIYLEKSQSPEEKILLEMLNKTECPSYLTLTTALPKEEELESSMENCSYGLTRRGGFVQSAKYHNQAVKKQTQYFFSGGSVFSKRFTGDVYDVGQKGQHPVYRYAKPIFLGVDL